MYHRDVNGVRTSYFVSWRGYPPTRDSWEPHAQLIADVLGLVEQYDETHPLRPKGAAEKRLPRTRIQELQSVNPFPHLFGDAHPPVRVVREVCLPRGTIAIVQTR